MILERWPNQEEAYQFAMTHSACMLDMDMGTGKTKVAIDVIMDRTDVRRVLIVCPKAVTEVWPSELSKHTTEPYECWVGGNNKSVKSKAEDLNAAVKYDRRDSKLIVVLNYDATWRPPMGDLLRRIGFDAIILDESHRAKAAGSKVSKYLFMLGRPVKYKLCLSGTVMANSPSTCTANTGSSTTLYTAPDMTYSGINMLYSVDRIATSW